MITAQSSQAPLKLVSQSELSPLNQFDEFMNHRLAQAIVSRTMEIIDCNVNIMDAHGIIIGSGDPERIGELHEGALLALSNGEMFTVDHSGS